MTTRDRLVTLIAGWDLEFDRPLLDDTPLITSGMLDSQALYNLMLWIEEQVGSPIDPTSFDVVLAWDTIADVVEFVEQRRQGG